MADTLNTFTYGRILLEHVQTVDFRQDAVYDPSDTDLLYTKFTLTVRGVLSQPLKPGTGTETAPEVLARIDHDLLMPRQYLCYRIGGKTVLEVGTADDGEAGKMVLDTNSGPKPRNLSTVQITAGTIFVKLTVEACVVDCTSTATQTRGFLSHRFTETETYDKCGYCTLETRGLIICRSDMRTKPDMLRGVAAPVIRDGYQEQDGKRFTLSPDGTKLEYYFIDKEYYLAPPRILDPKTLAEERALETQGRLTFATHPSGVIAAGNLSLMVKGGKNMAKKKLVTMVGLIYLSVIDRFRLGKDDDKTKAPLNQLSLTTDLWENTVELSARFTVDLKKVMPGAGGSEKKKDGTRTAIHAAIGAYIGGLPGAVIGALVPNAGDIADAAIGAVGLSKKAAQLGFFKFDIFDFEIPGSSRKDRPGIAPPLRGNNEFLYMLSAVFWDPCSNQVEKKSTGQTTTYTSTLTGGGSASGPSGQQSANTLFGFPAAGTLPPLFAPAAVSNGSLSVSTKDDAYGPGDEVTDAKQPVGNPLRRHGIPASIDVAEVKDTLAETVADEPVPYESYQIEVKTFWKGGSVALASTLPGTNRAKVRVHNPTLDMVVSWAASRVGERPEIPDPCAGDCNFLLTDMKFSTEELQRQPGGGYKYSVAGVYYYQLLDCSKFTLFEALPPFIIGDVKGVTTGDPYRTEAEGLYLTVKDILWWRVKKKLPDGQLYEACSCPDDSEATLRQSAGEQVGGELRGGETGFGFQPSP